MVVDLIVCLSSLDIVLTFCILRGLDGYEPSMGKSIVIPNARYNDDEEWRMEEKKKFVNKTKMSDLFEMAEEIPKPQIKKTIVQIRNNKMEK